MSRLLFLIKGSNNSFLLFSIRESVLDIEESAADEVLVNYWCVDE